MTKVAAYISVLLLLVAASVAASGVTNIELNKVGGFTTARIDIDGQIRFTHQTEDAKDGRPFRVIVDILSATHELGTKEFSVLPNCLIKGIRTSQFSVKPEQVVRIVFDMKYSPIYRVEPDNNSISVFFTDRSGPDFGPWSSTEYVKKTKEEVAPKQLESAPPIIAHSGKGVATSAASQNKAIATDRLASLAEAQEPVPKKADKPRISIASVQRASNVKVPPNPEINAKLVPPKEPPVPHGKKIAQGKSKKVADGKKAVVLKQVHSQWTVEPAPSTTVTNKSLAASCAPKVAKKADAKPKNEPKPSSRIVARSSVKVGTGPLQGPPPPPPAAKPATPKIAVMGPKAAPTAPASMAHSAPKQQAKTKTVAHKESKQPSAKKVVAQKKVQPAKGGIVKSASMVHSAPKQQAKTKTVAHKKSKQPSAKKVVAQKKVQPAKGDIVKSASMAHSAPKQQAKTKTVAHKESKQPSAKKVVAKKTQSSKTVKVVKVPQQKKTLVVASSTRDSKPASNEKSTSRFRRKPVISKKIRGTLVAEFPKRLTIKYRASSSHDPFETLINENRRYNEPIGKQVPNVEGLRLVGVIESSNGKNSALFEDKEGYGYILQSGDKVRKGYVLRVENDRVYFQIFEYGWSRTMALKMEEY